MNQTAISVKYNYSKHKGDFSINYLDLDVDYRIAETLLGLNNTTDKYKAKLYKLLNQHIASYEALNNHIASSVQILSVELKTGNNILSCEKVYSKEDLMIEFIQSEIQDIEVIEENNKFYVTGCLESHYGNCDEAPYCNVELETVGNTKKEALVNALIKVVNKIKRDFEEEKCWECKESEVE